MLQFSTSLSQYKRILNARKLSEDITQASSSQRNFSEKVTPGNSPKEKFWKSSLQQVKENTSLGKESVTDLIQAPAW